MDGAGRVDRVHDPALHSLLAAHRDQVRDGAEFPDGGDWTLTLGTLGGDDGEEAHWQRFVGQVLALRVAVDPTPCVSTPAQSVITSNHARATAWVPGT